MDEYKKDPTNKNLLVFIKKLDEDEIIKEKVKQKNMKILQIINTSRKIWGLHRVISTVKIIIIIISTAKISKSLGGIRTAKIPKALVE